MQIVQPLLVDPNLATCPDYASEAYRDTRATLINAHVDEAQSVILLRAIWTASNEADKRKWAQQLQEDETRRRELQRAEEDRQLQQHEAAIREQETALREEMKKNKTKFIPIPNRPVPNLPPIIPSAYALRKLEQGAYLELWYFTNAGLDDALLHTADDDTLSPHKEQDGAVTWVSSTATRPSRSVTQDSDLTFDDLAIAAPRMIAAMEDAAWPRDRVEMFASFWGNIQTHRFRSSPDLLDRRALLVYQAQQRKLWHIALKSTSGPYNLTMINEDLLRETKERIFWEDRRAKEKEFERKRHPFTPFIPNSPSSSESSCVPPAILSFAICHLPFAICHLPCHRRPFGYQYALSGGTMNLSPPIHPLPSANAPHTIAPGALLTLSVPIPRLTNLSPFDRAQTERPPLSVPYASVAISTSILSATPKHYGITAPLPLPKESTEPCPSLMDVQSASTGSARPAAPTPGMTNATSALDVAKPVTELRTAIEQRRSNPVTPYKPEAWFRLLSEAGLLHRYSKVPDGIRSGFTINLPPIHTTQAPPNKSSTIEQPDIFTQLISNELTKTRYIGPATQQDLEVIIGPFQTSPIAIIPKPHKPNAFRPIQDCSFPLNISAAFPNPSINSFTDSDDFPSTWGTFNAVAQLIHRLPPGSQAATRDVAEAYRTIPLHPSQWPATVVRVSETLFCLDTCLCFGESPSAGCYGHLGDAATDIFRHRGIGPLSKWVDDHLFFRILRQFLAAFNESRLADHHRLAATGPLRQGGRLYFGGHIHDDGTVEEFDEDCAFPFRDFSNCSPRNPEDSRYTYNFQDIDKVSDLLGIPWERSKDTAFSHQVTYIGFVWNLRTLTVALSPNKQAKYLHALHAWQTQSVHSLEELQKLHGKLVHVCAILPIGRPYLTSLESMLPLFNNRPFAVLHPPKDIAPDIQWWTDTLSSPTIERPIPHPRSVTTLDAFSDASSSHGLGILLNGWWHAWTLIPDWTTRHGSKDIAWAEAVAVELLIHHIINLPSAPDCFRLFCDNQGVVDAWAAGKSRNKPVNTVFRRINAFLLASHPSTSVHIRYIPSEQNPADPISRGIYPSASLHLPPLPLPAPVSDFLAEVTPPPHLL